MKVIISHKPLKNALYMMEKAMLKINSPIKVMISKKLPFMGYTTEKDGRHLIVVSGKFVKSDLLECMLIHELSHVYRKETNHPSHNHRLLDEVIHSITRKHRITEQYQQIILHHIVRYIQDLYASDISFKVFKKNQDKLPPLDVIKDFLLLRWMKPKSVRSNDKTKEKWANADGMLRNSVVISIMIRHKIDDNKGEDINEKFLSSISKTISKESRYFTGFMLRLKENITERKFGIELTKYLEKFVGVTK